MQIFYYLLLLPAAYIVLIAAPAIAMCFVVFSKKNNPASKRAIPTRDYYIPYTKEILAAIAELSALSPQEVSVISNDGAVLRGSYISGGFQQTAILLHGFRANPAESLAVAGKALYERRFNLLLIDQRAHGRSGGKHSLLGLKEQDDVLAWVNWATQSTNAKKLLLYGMSMGGAAIAYASDRLPADTVGAMVLDCGFTSPYDHLREDARKWHLPGRLLMPLFALYAKLLFHVDLRQKTGDTLARTTVPAVFLHGTADRGVRIAQGMKNFRRCASEKLWLPVADADHTVAFLKSSREEKETLFRFIQKYIKDTRIEP